jgi:hypothetical protein
MVMPHLGVQYLKRATLASVGSLTITHHEDSAGRLRRPRMVLAADGLRVATAYTEANYSTSVNLREDITPEYGVDAAQSASYSASTDSGGAQPAANAFDGNTVTYWQASSNSNEWIKCDFGTTKVIARYRFRTFSDTNYAPDDWTFEGSNDDSNWDTLDTVSSAGLSGATTYTYDITNGTAYRYYRLNISSGGAVGIIVPEINMYEQTNGPERDKIAQGVQVASNTTTKAVRLYMRKIGTPTGTMTLRIETDSSGEPSGTLVNANATTTVAESSLGTDWGWVTFTFSSTFTLTASTQYWVVLSTNRSASAANYVMLGADNTGAAYLDGEAQYETSSTWYTEVTNTDLLFQVMADGSAFDLFVDSRVAYKIEAGDGGSSSQDTQTTLTNLSPSSYDMMLVVEMS